jgi:hypothetical protein
MKRAFKDEAMKKNRMVARVVAVFAIIGSMCGGCSLHNPKPYGDERQLFLPGQRELVFAVAPTENVSGESQVDPLLNSDLVFADLQRVHGLTVIPVDRVAEVYASLKIDKVETEAQAFEICDDLGCDGLIIPTVTAYDPYDPPKVGGSLQLFLKPGSGWQQPRLDPHELDRAPRPTADTPMTPQWLVQVVGMFDANDGTVRDRIHAYEAGRYDPNGPLGDKEMYVSMDRYCSFVYHELIAQLLEQIRPALNPPPAVAGT